MADSTTLTIRINRAVKERLEALATSTKRSKSFLAAEAIEAFVDVNEWQIAQTRKAIAEADAGGPFVSHEDMAAWLLSWGTEDERPAPEPKIRRT
jgi:predicted transcriptional regulator